MNKHFLVTISNDCNSLFGVRFLCSFFKSMSRHQLTLFHICGEEGGEMNKSLSKMWDGPDGRGAGRVTVGAKKAITASEKMLNESKMIVEKVMTKTAVERYGKVKDILSEGTRGKYDAVVLGRRASYALQWLLERPGDEIAQAMIKDGGLSVPLWICPQIKDGKKNVLVCVDGSESSFRAVDHVGYILAHQDQHRITLFNVKDEKSKNPKEIFDKAVKILNNHNIQNDRITTESATGFSVAGKIVGYASQRGFAAVALGLNNLSTKGLQSTGQTTAKVIKQAEDISVWCCP